MRTWWLWPLAVQLCCVGVAFVAGGFVIPWGTLAFSAWGWGVVWAITRG